MTMHLEQVVWQHAERCFIAQSAQDACTLGLAIFEAFFMLLHACDACFCCLRDFIAQKRRQSVQLLLQKAVTCRDVAALRVRRMSLCQRQRCTRICFAAHLLRSEVMPEQEAVPQSCGLSVRVPVFAIASVDVAHIVHQRLFFERPVAGFSKHHWQPNHPAISKQRSTNAVALTRSRGGPRVFAMLKWVQSGLAHTKSKWFCA